MEEICQMNEKYAYYKIVSISSSERPIQEKLLSADTDNRPILPILSADISAENQANNLG